MLKSTTINRTYVGYTNNIKKRLYLHNSNKGAKSTKGNQWILIFKRRFLNKSDAMSFEYRLKKNKKKRQEIIINFKK